MTGARVLDVRHLPAPEPMEQILAAVHALARGQQLVALTPLRPVPLMALLDDAGYRCHVEMLEHGQARIVITHGDDALLPAPPMP